MCSVVVLIGLVCPQLMLLDKPKKRQNSRFVASALLSE